MKKSIILLILATVIICSCQKEEFNKEASYASIEDALTQDFAKFDYSQRNQDALNMFAQVTSLALKNINFRKILKEKALVQFDGDYNVLINFKTSNFKELEAELLNAYIKMNTCSETEAKQFLTQLSIDHPLLQLAIPIHCQEWDAKNYVPSVIFIPIGFDDQQNYSIKGYSNNGETLWFNKAVIPSIPVIVIGENERMESTDRYEPPGGGGGGGSGGGSGDRTDGDNEYVQKIYFSNLSAVESWIQGKPEIRLRVFAGSGGTELSADFFKPTRSWVNEEWWTIDHRLFNWHWGSYGDWIIMKWIEEDNGDPITISQSYTYEGLTTSIQYVMSDDDDEIGTKVVSKSDPKNTIYDTGIMKWYEDY